MFSPTFECSLDGLRSAVRLRHVLWGTVDPDAAAERYMRGYGISEADPLGTLRGRISMVIVDIEHLSVCDGVECSQPMAHRPDDRASVAAPVLDWS